MIGDRVQLTFNVGGEHDAPASSSFKVSGSLGSVKHELENGDEVKVVIWNADGEAIAQAEGVVKGISFPVHEPKNGPSWTERRHTIKLEG